MVFPVVVSAMLNLHFRHKKGIFALLHKTGKTQNIEKNLKKSDNFLDFSTLIH
jgi:hypothetical protein